MKLCEDEYQKKKKKNPVFTYHFWNGALNSRPSKWPDTDVIVTVTFWRHNETRNNQTQQNTHTAPCEHI